MRTREKDRLTRDAFHELLSRLGSDPRRAAAQYEDLRRRLITFFSYKGCFETESLADETLDRLAARLTREPQIDVPNLLLFAFGIAKNVVHEDRRKMITVSFEANLETVLSIPAASVLSEVEQSEMEARLAMLDEALSRLSSTERELLLSYYSEDYFEGAGRKKLARRLGEPISHLRVRVQRIRKKLRKEMEHLNESRSSHQK